MPVISKVEITYFRSLKLFDHFSIESQIMEVENNYLVIQHLVKKSDGLSAKITCRIKLLCNHRPLDLRDVFEEHFGLPLGDSLSSFM